jgi:DNA modification methylase
MTAHRALLLTPTPNGNGGFRDSAFVKNKELPIHRWVPWIAGFSAQFVDDCLSKYLPRNGKKDYWVLDAFAGVGTTLVQAFTQGFNVVGFEINPYAALASKVKLAAAEINSATLRAQISGFDKFMRHRCDSRNGRPRSQPPPGFSGRTELFSPRIERQVLFALDYIAGIQLPIIRDLFRLALGSVMVSFSNYSYEPSLTRRSAVDKQPITEADVRAKLSEKLNLMAEDVEWLRREIQNLGRRPRGRIYAETIFDAVETLGRKNFIDLVVTSPPYLNNYHYPRNTRPQLHWLGFASGRGYRGAKESSSFGKFWQTVRDLAPINLDFDMPALSQIMKEIASRNVEKGSYGGPGWANYVASYFNDTYRLCNVLSHLLKPDAAAVIVLGNSILQGVEVKTDYYFGKIAELCGLSFEDTILLREKRTGTSIIQSSVRVDKAAVKTVLYESAIVLRRRDSNS